LTSEIWHLTIDDLLAPLPASPRLGGAGPFVINLSASTAPISAPVQGIADCPGAHVYQIQRTEDHRVRFRLRMGPFETEEQADALLQTVREIYPSALTATAESDDLRAIDALKAKIEAQQLAAVKAAAMKAPPITPSASSAAAGASASTGGGASTGAGVIAASGTAAASSPLTPASRPAPAPDLADAPLASTPPPAWLALFASGPARRPDSRAPAGGTPSNAPPAAVAPEVSAKTPAARISPTPQAQPEERPAAPGAIPVLSDCVEVAPRPALADAPDSPVRPAVAPPAPPAPAAAVAPPAPAAVVAPPAPAARAAIAAPSARPRSPSPAAPAPVPRPREVAPAAMAPLKSAGASEAAAPIPPAAPVWRKPEATANARPAVASAPAPALRAVPPPAATPAPSPRQGPAPIQPAKAVPRRVEALSTPLPSLETTQTLRPLTPVELQDDSLRWFAIQLALSEESFDPDTLPNLDIFGEYRLYSVASLDQGKVIHALRLGFFAEETAATAVAGYLSGFYDKPVVKRISVAERTRFSDQRVEARKDIGATGRHAVIEITDERAPRARRSSPLTPLSAHPLAPAPKGA